MMIQSAQGVLGQAVTDRKQVDAITAGAQE